MRGASSSPVRQAGTPRSFLTFTQIGSPLPSSWNSLPVALLVIALCSDQRSRRPTDKLQILPRNPGLARGLDPSLLASHLDGPWHVVNVQEGAGFVTDSSLAENFHVINQHHCVVLRNKDTFARDCSCTAIQVPCSLRCSSLAIKGMDVSGKFRRCA